VGEVEGTICHSGWILTKAAEDCFILPLPGCAVGWLSSALTEQHGVAARRRLQLERRKVGDALCRRLDGDARGVDRRALWGIRDKAGGRLFAAGGDHLQGKKGGRRGPSSPPFISLPHPCPLPFLHLSSRYACMHTWWYASCTAMMTSMTLLERYFSTTAPLLSVTAKAVVQAVGP
jgi:hypothetical protein